MIVKFILLKIEDKRPTGCELHVGNLYEGLQSDDYRIHYTDRTGTDWIFYIGDTCEIVL